MNHLSRFSDYQRRCLNEFWPEFLAAHLDRRSQLLHCAGTVFLFACVGLFGITGQWWFLPLAFLGYAPSWVGHFFFEKNRPPTLKTPVIAGLCELKMVALIFAGEMNRELIRLFGSANPKPGTACIVTPEEEMQYQESLRFRIREGIASHPFGDDYWNIFLMKHQSFACVCLHILAMLYLYALVGYALWTGSCHLLILVPLAQGIGLVSHAVFERNHIDFEDAIFSPRAFASLNKMLFLVLTGRYFKEARRAALRLQDT